MPNETPKEIIGKLVFKDDAKAIGSGSFVKREFAIKTDEQYPQSILLELHQDRVDLLDVYEIGEMLKISINLRGREWVNPQGETKYFNTLVAWKIERFAVASPAPAPTPAQETTNYNEDEPDDLPF
jgi:hypothetical protein